MENKHWIGIDFGGTNVRIGVFDNETRLVNEKKFPTEADRGPEYIIDNLKRNIETIKGDCVLGGIGIGMPGPLNPYEGIVLAPVNLPGWENIPLADILGESFGVPCYIENDCNVAALAESLEGAGEGYPIVFYITVSTGIGGGLCINGEIISGAYGNAGEIGNIIVSEQPVKHSFLNLGSLEGMSSGTSILRFAKEKGLKIQQAHEIFKFAREGNKAAGEIVNTAMDSLAKGMSAIAHVIEPHIFIFGGGVAKTVPNFAFQMKERFAQYIYPIMRNKIQVELAKLTEPGMIGAMYLAKKKIVKLENYCGEEAR